jgi:hypothetical protein
MPIWLVARRSFVYAGQQLVPGEVFEAKSLHDASVLKIVDHARDAVDYHDTKPEPDHQAAR